jgi:hypothetical protein
LQKIFTGIINLFRFLLCCRVTENATKHFCRLKKIILFKCSFKIRQLCSSFLFVFKNLLQDGDILKKKLQMYKKKPWKLVKYWENVVFFCFDRNSKMTKEGKSQNFTFPKITLSAVFKCSSRSFPHFMTYHWVCN